MDEFQKFEIDIILDYMRQSERPIFEELIGIVANMIGVPKYISSDIVGQTLLDVYKKTLTEQLSSN